MNWEDIGNGECRAKVFGGWLVKVQQDVHVSLHEDMRPQEGYEWREAMAFVPDPEHKWNPKDFQ